MMYFPRVCLLMASRIVGDSLKTTILVFFIISLISFTELRVFLVKVKLGIIVHNRKVVLLKMQGSELVITGLLRGNKEVSMTDFHLEVISLIYILTQGYRPYLLDHCSSSVLYGNNRKERQKRLPW